VYGFVEEADFETLYEAGLCVMKLALDNPARPRMILVVGQRADEFADLIENMMSMDYDFIIWQDMALAA
jgi:hypothetical protein